MPGRAHSVLLEFSYDSGLAYAEKLSHFALVPEQVDLALESISRSTLFRALGQRDRDFHPEGFPIPCGATRLGKVVKQANHRT